MADLALPDPAAEAAVRNKQIYKITYPNGKIYVGMDLTGTTTYFGSPSAKVQIAADFGDGRHDFSIRKQILWESQTATDTEVRRREIEYIVSTGANNPSVGYNKLPRFRGAR